MTEPIDTQELAYNLEAKGKGIVGLLYTNLFSTITPEQFGQLTEEKKNLFNDRIVMLRELEEVIVKLTFISTYESTVYRQKKESLKTIIETML